MRFCFSLGWTAGLAAVTLCGAGLPDRPQRITSAVRADFRTGKLVRSVIVAPKSVAGQRVAEVVVAPRVVSAAAPASEPQPPSGIDAAVEQIAAQYSLSPQLIHSVIKVESNYNPFAISPKGALGLMQLIPSTARRFGVSDVFNPMQNIQGGAKYLKYLLDLYKQDSRLALAAYNAGEEAVARYGGVPPFAETRNYVIQVANRLREANQAAAAWQKEKEVKPVEIKPAGPTHIREIVEADGSVRYVSR
jgi:soluble lytic murein transglycosylase-like protein